MSSHDPLTRYRERRTPGRTPEPLGPPPAAEAGRPAERPAGAGRFCIQKHAARRTHYDLRLELDGVLKSWAVPKGPSNDPTEKRLAVQVEDHPLEYADFEGVIPAGEYGGGPVILWESGRWTALEDPVEGLERGKLLFELRGHKLWGTWTLVRIRGETGNEWLLIRERRGRGGAPPAGEPGTGGEHAGEEWSDRSILSGLTVEERLEVDSGRVDFGEPVREALEALESEGARRRPVRPEAEALMLARTRDGPFSDPEWLFELKLDGYRMLAGRREAEPFLLTRQGNDATASFPEVAVALAALPFGDLILDGEVVVHDESGRPSFQRLQGRSHLMRPADIRRAGVERPATFYAFDLLSFEGWDLRGLPLRRRKPVLETLLPDAGPLRALEHYEGAGEALYEQVKELGLEGIMAKRADSPYVAGRRGEWLKIHVPRTGLFAVVGYTRPSGRRKGLGALHLAVCPRPDDEADGPSFVYAGKVGTGFTDARLRELRERLEPLRRPDPPCVGPVPRGRENVWVEPQLVCEVRYKEWTEQGILRAPVFLGLRDRPLEDCRRQDLAPRPAGAAGAAEPARVEGGPPSADALALTNLDKVFWPEEGYTKGDLLDYYRAVAPWLLPFLADRPVVLTRYPDGIEGKSFFQKDAPAFAPEWIRTETIWSEGSKREISYFVVNDEASLAYLVNLGTIPLHVWASRVTALDRPDWCVLDLDPKEAPFADVVTIARALREMCERIELPCFVKTSGSTGLHLMIPLGGQLGQEDTRALGELLARLAVSELPEIATVVRSPERREGKVYVDYVQNGRGRLIVAPYSVRPLPGATVSAPLRWSEVTPGLEMGRFNIRSMPRRLRALKEDPLRPVLELTPDLPRALERLGRSL